jgi:hypothetical protein
MIETHKNKKNKKNKKYINNIFKIQKRTTCNLKTIIWTPLFRLANYRPNFLKF